MIGGPSTTRSTRTACMRYPKAPRGTGTSTSANRKGTPKPLTRLTPSRAPKARNSPWAKLITRITPKIRLRPHAIRA